jgi:hypothetical protein
MDKNNKQNENNQNEIIEEQEQEPEKDTTLFQCVDKSVLTLFNEPSLGLYFTQQHIRSSFPKMLYHMDSLYENRKKINTTILDVNNTIRDIQEMTSLNEDFSYKMLAKIKSISYCVNNK